MKFRLIFLILFVCVVNAWSQAYKYSNEFLSLGVGGRALAMGNATVASVSDINAGYWNPSAMVGLQNNLNLGVMHASYFGDLAKYDYGAVAIKNSDSSAFGISIIRVGVDDIPNTLELVDANGNFDYSKLSSFSVADYAALLSYARKLKQIEHFDYAVNVKIIRRVVGDFASAWGFGFDAAAHYTYKNFLLGAIIRDVTSTFNAWHYNTSTFEEAFIKTGNAIPSDGLEITTPKLIIAAAYQHAIKEKFSILAELDADFTFDKKRNTLIKSSFASIDPHAGIEMSYMKMIFVRAGLSNIQHVTSMSGKNVLNVQPSIGIGIEYKRFGIDYAFTDIGNASAALYSNVVSLKYGFDRK